MSRRGVPGAGASDPTENRQFGRRWDHEPGPFVRSFRVGSFICTWTLQRTVTPGLVSETMVEWEPNVPKRLSDRHLEQYREGRAKVFAEYEQETGIRVGVIDV